jgi:hypothetical protein
MSKKKKSGKGKKPTPVTTDVVASNSGEDTQVNVEENTLATEEKVPVATPTATNEEMSSEDVDNLDKELEEKGTIKEEKIANNDTTEAETAGEEAAKLAAEAEAAAKKAEEEAAAAAAAAAAAKIVAEEGRRTVRGDASFSCCVISYIASCYMFVQRPLQPRKWQLKKQKSLQRN